MEICISPTTFKDISAFFENKTLEMTSMKTSEQKKLVRAKRSLILNRQMILNQNDLIKSEGLSSTTGNESIEFYHQIKRMKTMHKFQFNSIHESERIMNNNFTKRSNDKSWKNILSKRWLILLLIILAILVYFYLADLKNIYRLKIFIQPENSPLQSNELTDIVNNNNNKNVIFRYGQFVRNCFFSSVDLFLNFIGQLFFRIDKYEYKSNIVYIVSSTYENVYDWFIPNIFKCT